MFWAAGAFLVLSIQVIIFDASSEFYSFMESAFFHVGRQRKAVS